MATNGNQKMFIAIFDSRSSIVKRVSIAVYPVCIQRFERKTFENAIKTKTRDNEAKEDMFGMSNLRNKKTIEKK